MKRKLIAMALSAVLLVSVCGDMNVATAFAASQATETSAANDQLAAISGLEELGHMEQTEDGIQFVEEDESLQEVQEPAQESALFSTKSVISSAEAQASFSLVEEGYIPAVRNQKNSNNCWAYGAMASLESNLLLTGEAKKETLNLSENHLTWFTYKGKNGSAKSRYAGKDTFQMPQTGKPYQEGGNRWLSTATLARWYGAVDQSRAASASSLSQKLQVTSDLHLENADFLPSPKTTSGRKTIKRYLATKGAVTINYYHQESLLKKKDGKYVYCCSTDQVANHEVTIVGWDDSVSAGGKSGAWIARNSYGTSWGDGGYFYLSYYDNNLCNPTFYEAESRKYKKGGSHDYSGIYQYDGVGTGDAEFARKKSIAAANRYKARRNELVRAVGTYTGAANSTVTISIYVNPSPGKPASGKKACSVSFEVPYAGYHTLELKKPVGVPKGCEFSVVVKTSYKSGGKRNYFLPVETQVMRKNLLVSIDCSKGQSYMKLGKRWEDVTNIKPISIGSKKKCKIGNALAKALTTGSGSKKQMIRAKAKYVKKVGSKAFSLQAKRTRGEGMLLYKSSNRNVATVSPSGKVRIKGTGKAIISIMAAPSEDYKAAVKKVTIIVKPKKAH